MSVGEGRAEIAKCKDVRPAATKRAADGVPIARSLRYQASHRKVDEKYDASKASTWSTAIPVRPVGMRFGPRLPFSDRPSR